MSPRVERVVQAQDERLSLLAKWEDTVLGKNIRRQALHQLRIEMDESGVYDRQSPNPPWIGSEARDLPIFRWKWIADPGDRAGKPSFLIHLCILQSNC